MNRYVIDGFASLETNFAGYKRSGRIVSQTPLASTFTTAAPCENGMWLNANIAEGVIDVIDNVGQVIGISYTSEKEYTRPNEVGLNTFSKVGGDYPRVGLVEVGDTFTTNCFGYETSDFANDAAVRTALDSLATTPLYLIPVVGNGAPRLCPVAGITGAKTVARVVKKTTIPNGDLGIKYVFVSVAPVGGV